MISFRDWCPWMKPGYITTAQRQSNNQWSDGIAAHHAPPQPKNFLMKKSAGKVLALIFLDQDGILLIDYLPKGHTINAEYYSSLLVLAIEGHFEGKTPIPEEGNQGGLVLAQCPCSLGTCNPQETGLPGLPMS